MCKRPIDWDGNQLKTMYYVCMQYAYVYVQRADDPISYFLEGYFLNNSLNYKETSPRFLFNWIWTATQKEKNKSLKEKEE